jgi:chorismate lyase / 3-hydroxybenzoate synthase
MSAAPPLLQGPCLQPGQPLLHPLRVERLSPAAWLQQARSSRPPLGGLGWGWAVGGVVEDLGARGLAPLHTPVLSADGPWVDAWHSTAAELRRGRSGSMFWQADDDWAFGHLEIPDADTDLAETTRRAYGDVFAALQDCGRPHVLRLWNYLPRINADGGGLERYRQFNIGRQQAFMDAGRDAFEGAPAACALGTSGAQAGGLAIRFLAGRVAARPVENPRQVSAYRYSAVHGPRAPTFSRAALADAGAGRVLLLISGTASIVGERSLHPGDVMAQSEETLRNLQAVLDAAMARCSARFTLADLQGTVYVRHAADAPAVLALWARAVPGAPAPRCVQADICRAELLVEIEAHAFATGALTEALA